jgi:hypothetical protein
MPSINKDSLETDDSSFYDCSLRPCIYCSSPEPCEAFDASASNLSSACPYFWKPIPQTQDEMNEQMRLDYEEQERWEECRSASLWCKEYFGHN